MGDKVHFVFVIHNHQPVGNFDSVFNESVEKSYKPLIETLIRFPKVKVGLHFTGPLLEWIESNKPELISLIRQMCEKGHVEILGGGWSEPILTVLPDRDSIGQLKMMKTECVRLFGQEPKGMWLPERVWDPDLPRFISDADYSYTLLDDTHFYYSGINKKKINGYYLTEKIGKPLAILPIDRHLRYAIPFKSVPEAINEIIEGNEGQVVTYGDDGEKFGIWPGTYEWVWEKNWLNDFLTALSENETIETIFPYEAMERFSSSGRIYPPTASYAEMGEWTLPAEAGIKYENINKKLQELGLKDEMFPFIRGSIWLNFFAKYSESNRMHKRMLMISNKIHQGIKKSKDNNEMTAIFAKKELFRGQCNCPYWHGLFGGLYLPHLRDAVFRRLLNAENIIEKIIDINPLEELDFDGDFTTELFLNSKHFSIILKPDQGGQIVELDLKKHNFHLTNVLTRRYEAYHEKIKQAAAKSEHTDNSEQPKSIHDIVMFKESGLEEKLHYDPYDRLCFHEHLLSADSSIKEIMSVQNYKPAIDWGKQKFNVVEKKAADDFVFVKQESNCRILQGDITLEKSIKLDRSNPVIEIDYEIKSQNNENSKFLFASEWVYNFLSSKDPKRYIQIEDQSANSYKISLDDIKDNSNVKKIILKNEADNIAVKFDSETSAQIWSFPLETISQSEAGFERIYQGSVLVFVWQIELINGKTSKFKILISE